MVIQIAKANTYTCFDFFSKIENAGPPSEVRRGGRRLGKSGDADALNQNGTPATANESISRPTTLLFVFREK
jgi:hypothetical protein